MTKMTLHNDAVYASFLCAAAEDALAINAASKVVELSADANSGTPPSRYAGVVRNVEHLVPRGDGTIVVSCDPLLFAIDFPADYCRSVDANLGFRVVRILSELTHPNHRSATLCLGERFEPATRLRAIVYRLYLLISGRSFATESPLDAAAAAYYLAHPEQVARLQAAPLWRRESAARVVAGGAVATPEAP